MNGEPLVNTALVTAVVGSFLTLVVAFGLELSEGQTQAILGFVAVVAPLGVAVLTRSKVTPVDQLRR